MASRTAAETWGRRPQLGGLVPGTRDRPPLPWSAGRAGGVLRPYPLAEPGEFGVLALEFTDPDDYQSIEQGDVLILEDLRSTLRLGSVIRIQNSTRGRDYSTRHRLSARQVGMVLAGGLLPARQSATGRARRANRTSASIAAAGQRDHPPGKAFSSSVAPRGGGTKGSSAAGIVGRVGQHTSPSRACRASRPVHAPSVRHRPHMANSFSPPPPTHKVPALQSEPDN